MSSQKSHILLEIADSIATITLARPEKRNALNTEMRTDLIAALQRIRERADVRVIVITGQGSAFCAGGDISVLKELKDSNDEAGFEQLLDDGRTIVRLIREAPIPVLAKVNGPAFGAGFFLATACDLRLCGESASFGVPLVDLGLGPEWSGTYYMPRMIGTSLSLEMLITGRSLTAQEAERVGLANHVWPDSELGRRTTAIAQQVVTKPPAVLARFKQAIYASMDQPFDLTAALERRYQLENFRADDAREGIEAFLEKRPPKFVSGDKTQVNPQLRGDNQDA